MEQEKLATISSVRSGLWQVNTLFFFHQVYCDMCFAGLECCLQSPIVLLDKAAGPYALFTTVRVHGHTPPSLGLPLRSREPSRAVHVYGRPFTGLLLFLHGKKRGRIHARPFVSGIQGCEDNTARLYVCASLLLCLL